MCVKGEQQEPNGRATAPLTPLVGVEKSSFQIAAIPIGDRPKCETRFLVLKWCHGQSYNFSQSPKPK